MFGLLPMPLAFLGISLAAWGTIAAVSAVAVTGWQIVESRSQAKKAASTAKKVAGIQAAAQREYAGEYFDLSKRQMEMQSQQRQIDTIANLIESRSEKGPMILTTSTATGRGILDQINLAIDKFVRG